MEEVDVVAGLLMDAFQSRRSLQLQAVVTDGSAASITPRPGRGPATSTTKASFARYRRGGDNPLVGYWLTDMEVFERVINGERHIPPALTAATDAGPARLVAHSGDSCVETE